MQKTWLLFGPEHGYFSTRQFASFNKKGWISRGIYDPSNTACAACVMSSFPFSPHDIRTRYHGVCRSLLSLTIFRESIFGGLYLQFLVGQFNCYTSIPELLYSSTINHQNRNKKSWVTHSFVLHGSYRNCIEPWPNTRRLYRVLTTSPLARFAWSVLFNTCMAFSLFTVLWIFKHFKYINDCNAFHYKISLITRLE